MKNNILVTLCVFNLSFWCFACPKAQENNLLKLDQIESFDKLETQAAFIECEPLHIGEAEDLCVNIRIENKSNSTLCVLYKDLPDDGSTLTYYTYDFVLTYNTTGYQIQPNIFQGDEIDSFQKAPLVNFIYPSGVLDLDYNLSTIFGVRKSAAYGLEVNARVFDCNSISKDGATFMYASATANSKEIEIKVLSD